MGRRREEPGAGPRVALLLAAAVLCVWALGMFTLTAAAAETAAQGFVEANSNWAERVMRVYSWDLKDGDSLAPWYAAKVGADGGTGYRSVSYLPRDTCLERCGSAAVYDADGNMLACSWQGFIIAEACTVEQWEAADYRSGAETLILFDRELLAADAEKLENAYALKFTGEFGAGGFIASGIAGIDYRDFADARRETACGSIPEVMRASGLEWEELYRDPDASGTVTLYAKNTVVNCPERSGKLSFAATDSDEVLTGRYEDLDGLTVALEEKLRTPPGEVWGPRRSGLNLVVPSATYCYEYEGKMDFNINRPIGLERGVIAYIVCASSCSPWLIAARELIWYYLAGLAIAALAWSIAYAGVRRQLIIPMRAAADALLADGHPAVRTGYIWRWRESEQLREGVSRRRDEILKLENERSRLSRALEYAKTAEENRRRTISAVAHELKTPLAVIHSYAEGLREHIAEDKREKYVSVILSEAERSDAMVLEMLDFSRLEAGKIRLARDEFSLAALISAGLEKLEIQIEGKRLNVNLDFPEEFTIVADEQRIAQALGNLASNAVKYTPDGGSIDIKIDNDSQNCTVTFSNDSPGLTAGQLEKVWEPFYRADAARTEPGTGLGLAITRSIIQLHGGKCFAAATESGVSFGFTLPR